MKGRRVVGERAEQEASRTWSMTGVGSGAVALPSEAVVGRRREVRRAPRSAERASGDRLQLLLAAVVGARRRRSSPPPPDSPAAAAGASVSANCTAGACWDLVMRVSPREGVVEGERVRVVEGVLDAVRVAVLVACARRVGRGEGLAGRVGGGEGEGRAVGLAAAMGVGVGCAVAMEVGVGV